MAYLLEPAWQVGEPANGSRDAFQCPTGCLRLHTDYSGNDPAIQFPQGWHVVAGLPSADTFHQGEPFEPTRVRVRAGRDHTGRSANLLRVEGGAPTLAHKAMLVKRLETPVDWTPGAIVRLTTNFKPTTENYANTIEAAQHLFCNIELRGKLMFERKHLANQILGVFLRGDKIFVMYWDATTTFPATPASMRRFEFPKSLDLNAWHRLRVLLTARAEPDMWDARVRVSVNGRELVNWESGAAPIFGARQVNTIALGDERPRDFDGGVWYWERLRLERL